MQWKQRENIILRMKYRVKSVRNGPEEETKIEVNLAIQKMEAEDKIRQMWQRNSDCYRATNRHEIKDKLTDLLQKEIFREAAKSEYILDKKRLEEYEKTV